MNFVQFLDNLQFENELSFDHDINDVSPDFNAFIKYENFFFNFITKILPA